MALHIPILGIGQILPKAALASRFQEPVFHTKQVGNRSTVHTGPATHLAHLSLPAALASRFLEPVIHTIQVANRPTVNPGLAMHLAHLPQPAALVSRSQEPVFHTTLVANRSTVHTGLATHLARLSQPAVRASRALLSPTIPMQTCPHYFLSDLRIQSIAVLRTCLLAAWSLQRLIP